MTVSVCLYIMYFQFCGCTGVYRGGVDAACVQFGSREKEFPTKGKNLLLFHLKFAFKSLVLFSC